MSRREPAFPQSNDARYEDPIHGVVRPSDIDGDAHPGMDLRDYFAAAALPAVMAARTVLVNANLSNDLNQESIAEECYELADALLVERKRNAEARS